MFDKLINQKTGRVLTDVTLSAEKQKHTERNKPPERYEILNAKGLLYLQEFLKQEKKEFLQRATASFVESVNLKRKQAEPYFFLAQIAFLTGEQELARKYLKIATVLDSSYPGLKDFQKLIK